MQESKSGYVHTATDGDLKTCQRGEKWADAQEALRLKMLYNICMRSRTALKNAEKVAGS